MWSTSCRAREEAVDRMEARDPDTGAVAPMFNPRRGKHNFLHHFAVDAGCRSGVLFGVHVYGPRDRRAPGNQPKTMRA